ncbi:MAG TPA: hypothetical protein VGO56_06000 [Pyrinomonadaceae bacterium]|jgi:hypothetical protein|nr:hypothetical protein [Pyrinomonadaceae bacterium]
MTPLLQPRPTRSLKHSCAFVATSFGFGPVSKAVSIASEMKAQAPDLETHYFGAGIGYDYAQKSAAFDSLVKVDVDRHETLVSLLPQLAAYGAVFSVLNLDILTLWRSDLPPLYFVDSLAWMWPSLPAGIGNAAVYFVQDYLLSRERIRDWSLACPLVLVAPIESVSSLEVPPEKVNRLLVNFAGCANPFAPSELYEKYGFILTSSILEEAEQRYERIVFCCNEPLANYLRRSVGAASSVEFRHFAHDEFLQLLVSSQRVLSAPGITSTVEALASQTDFGFLLPQNDSQALISERCRSQLGEESCMAFSRFGPEFYFPPFLPPGESVSLALTHLEKILSTRQPEIRSMIQSLLSLPTSYSIANLRANTVNSWSGPGQQGIVSHFLSQTRM